MSKFGKERRSPWTWNWFLQLANCIECLPWARLRALHCGHHCTVPGVQGSGAGAGVAVACFSSPLHFSAFLLFLCSSHYPSVDTCQEQGGVKRPLYEKWGCHPLPLHCGNPWIHSLALWPWQFQMLWSLRFSPFVLCPPPTCFLPPPSSLSNIQLQGPWAMGEREGPYRKLAAWQCSGTCGNLTQEEECRSHKNLSRVEERFSPFFHVCVMTMRKGIQGKAW